MHALVTGGTGFVGSHVVRALLDAGHRVRVLHRTTSKLDALNGLDYESALGDILDRAALSAACAGIDVVFHVAAVADYWRADKSRMFEANVEGTRRVLLAAQSAGVERVVFTSSAAAVGPRHDGRPARESDPLSLSPSLFPYAHSKGQAEGVVMEMVAAGLDVVTVNPVIVLGPGDLNQISGSMVTQVKQLGPLVPLPSGGAGVTDVRDVARWHLAAVERGATGERYILGTENVKHADLFRLITREVGAASPFLRVPDFVTPLAATLIDGVRRVGIPVTVDSGQTRLSTRDIYFDYSKTHGTLGSPQIDIARSVRDTVRWYAAQGII